MTRRYAEDTTVSIAKSRGEIDGLLRQWGCTQIAWVDDYEHGAARLQFLWKRGDDGFVARFEIKVPDDNELEKLAVHATTGAFLPARFDKLCAARGRHQHRVLALWIKAALNAVEAGIVEPAAIFLPWLVGRDGRTVAEVALPRLGKLLEGGAQNLLEAGA